MTIVGCVVRGGMLAPPCAVPVKVEATVPVGAFSHGVGRHHSIRAASGSCGYWSAGIIHARTSVTSGRSVREGNRTSGRIGRKGSGRVKRGYVRPCHFRGGNVCAGQLTGQMQSWY
jgi:hypothetical protein